MSEPVFGSPLQSDEELFVQYIVGDNGAFNTLVERHNRSLINIAFYGLRDTPIAEDVVQECWLAIVRKQSDYDRTRPFVPWLRGFLNKAIQKARDRLQSKREFTNAEEILVLQAGRDTHNNDIAKEVERVLAELSSLGKIQREITEFRLAGMSHRKIAAILKISVENARQLYHRLIIQLRASFHDE